MNNNHENIKEYINSNANYDVLSTSYDSHFIEQVISASYCSGEKSGFLKGVAFTSSAFQNSYIQEETDMTDAVLLEKLDKIKGDINANIDKIDAKLENLRKEERSDFENLGNKLLEKIDDKFTKLDDKITGTGGIKERIDRIDERTKISIKSKEIWIPVLCALIVAALNITANFIFHK